MSQEATAAEFATSSEEQNIDISESQPSVESQEEVHAQSVDDALSEIWDKHQSDEIPQNKIDDVEKEEPEKVVNESGPDAPYSWTKEEKEAWKQAPDGVKNALIRRSQEVEAYAMQTKQATDFARAMQPIGNILNTPEMKDYMRNVRWEDGRRLIDDPQLVAQEINAVLAFKRDFLANPREGLNQLITWAQQWGIDIEGQPDHTQQGNQASREVNELRRRLDQMNADQHAREDAARNEQRTMMQRAAVQHMGDTVTSFADVKDGSGNYAYPHMHGDSMEEICGAMRVWCQNYAGNVPLNHDVLKKAYEFAIYANPKTRELELRGMGNRASLEAERAKKAAGKWPQPTGKNRADASMNEDDAMAAIWAKYNS